MIKLPEYLGPMAFGLKMGVILPGMNIVDKVFAALEPCHRDGLLGDGDVICVTESVVARAQNNYVSVDRVAGDIKAGLNLADNGRVGVVFPIASRNRFSLILRGIARGVPRGHVVVQFSMPFDEVGNQVIPPGLADQLGPGPVALETLKGQSFAHPVTGVDYLRLYKDIIESEGARAEIILGNDPLCILDYQPDGVIAADIHSRAKTSERVRQSFANCITLDQVCNRGEFSSEWGLLGSNMSCGERLKLAPRDCKEVVLALQRRVNFTLGIKIEALIYGDGAYLDPSSGIYELADPRAAFAATDGLQHMREGFKYKFLADRCFLEEDKDVNEIEAFLAEARSRDLPRDSMEREGTTPRQMEDVLASLADLVSGSADAGTPVVVIKGFLS